MVGIELLYIGYCNCQMFLKRRFIVFGYDGLQCYAEKQARGEVEQELLDTQVNPAVWEISGHMVLKRRKDYDDASEQYAWKLLSDVSLSDERFQEVEKYVRKAANLQEDEDFTSTEETSYVTGTPQVSPHLPQDCLVLR